MASDTVAFLERVVGGAARVVGCSAGASVALLVALRRPDLVRRLVLIAGVFHRDGWVQDAIDPDVSPPEVLARGYPELSPDACGVRKSGFMLRGRIRGSVHRGALDVRPDLVAAS
jgi:pimeloyl-ACP methyl ester carboxylesterase